MESFEISSFLSSPVDSGVSVVPAILPEDPIQFQFPIISPVVFSSLTEQLQMGNPLKPKEYVFLGSYV